jgi:signal transduction histidine kinase
MRRSIPIRWFLTVPFVVLILALVSWLIYLSYSKDRHFIALYEQELSEAIGERIEAHLISFFAIPEVIVLENLEEVQTGVLQISQWEDLVRRFVIQIRHNPFLTYVSAGLNDGSYVGAHRELQNNTVQLFTALPHEGGLFNRYAVTADNKRGELLEQGKSFNARTRSWFRNALKADSLAWYPIYKYYAYNSLGVGVAAPIYSEHGIFQGVLTADLALSQLNSFLKTLRIGKDGQAFLCTADGLMIASSRQDTLYQVVGDSVHLLHLTESSDPVLRMAGAQVQAGIQDRQVRLEVQGAKHLLHLRTYHSSHGLDLLIGVVIPEHMYIQPIHRESWQALMVILFSGLLCTILSWLLARKLAQPLENLQIEANELAQRRWVQRNYASPVLELDALSNSFQRMAIELSESMQTLEQRVALRTVTLEQANENLKELNALKDKFFSIVSHDLKNPLLTILGLSDYLIDELNKKEFTTAEETAKVLQQSAQSGYKLLLNLLEWSRSQLGLLDVCSQNLLLADHVNEVVELFRHSLAEKDLKLKVDSADVMVHCDRHILQTVIRNLLANALKYTPRGGNIHLYTSTLNNRVQLHVQDSGIGIAESDLGKLFRVDAMFSHLGTEKEKGTGLGLILCKDFLQRVGGNITVQSEIGKGSCFTLDFPCATAPIISEMIYSAPHK